MHLSAVSFPNDIAPYTAQGPRLSTSKVLPYYYQGMFVVLKVERVATIVEGMLQQVEHLEVVVTVVNAYDFPPASDLAQLAEQKNFKVGEEPR